MKTVTLAFNVPLDEEFGVKWWPDSRLYYHLYASSYDTEEESDLTGILYQFVREYSEGFERDGGVGQGPAFEALAPHQR